MRSLQFALIREGTSDDGLVPHIRALLIRAGATSVVGAPRLYPGSTKRRLAQVLAEGDTPQLIFVHRDADTADHSTRRNEILQAAEELQCAERVVPVVPVQELEAWLLTDETAIRRIAGRPSGKVRLDLPTLKSIEATSRPKEVLQEACATASEKSGARLKKERAQFNARRASLLERLDIDGQVTRLPSWNRFVADLRNAYQFVSL